MSGTPAAGRGYDFSGLPERKNEEAALRAQRRAGVVAGALLSILSLPLFGAWVFLAWFVYIPEWFWVGVVSIVLGIGPFIVAVSILNGRRR